MAEVQQHSDKQSFLRELTDLQLPGPAWAQAIREKYARRFAELDLPNRRMEDWRFTNIQPILRTPFRSLLSPTGNATASDVASFHYGDGDWTELVFVNGFYARHLSTVRPGVVAESLIAAVNAQAPGIESHLGRYVNGTSNAFTALNSAFLLDGAYIRIGLDASAPSPIHLICISTQRDTDTAAYPRNLIVLEPGARAAVVESHVATNTASRYLTNAVSEIAVGENASLYYCKLIQEADEAYHLATTRVRIDRGGSFKSHAISLAGKIIRNEISVVLDGDGANASLNGLYMTSGDQLVDNPTSIEHAKPHCTSWIGYKGVLDDKSHAVFSGKIYVHRIAQKTDSNQLNQNMVLSDKATIDTKPLLEIFADDVKCTHGATVGRPPNELVFYFRTRGMSEAMALGMLTYGFADEVVNQIDLQPVRERLERFVFNKYSPIKD